MSDFSLFDILIKISLFAIIAYTCVLRSLLSLAPWVPTPKKEFTRINRVANLKPRQLFYEIGCGDGRVLLYISKQNPEVEVVGIEISLVFYLIAKFRVLLTKAKNVRITYGDALKQNLSKPDVVYTYSIPEALNTKLMPKIKKELKPGARFVSYAFEIRDKEYLQTDRVEGQSNIYVYTQP